MSGRPEVVDNGARYLHADALRSMAENQPRPLSVATGYLNLGGLRELAMLPGPSARPIRLLVGAMPAAGLGDHGLIDETLEAGRIFDETLRRLRVERDFDSFPPSRRVEALQSVSALLTDERIEVRRYMERFLHGKAYVFADPPGTNQGAAEAVLVTSANLTSAGMFSNRELGLVNYQPAIVDEALGWFDELWTSAVDVKADLQRLLFPEIPEYTPQQIFLRMLLEYYGDELPAEVSAPADRLARFQRDGFVRALSIVERYGGVLYADGVGTGKTHVALEFISEYARKKGLHVLVIAPAQLRDRNWQHALIEANLPGQVVSFQELAEDEQLARSDIGRKRRILHLDKEVYRLVIVDEAHALRSPDTTYYFALNRLLGGAHKDLLLLTATPVNNALWDLYHQIMLFARHDAAFADDPLAIRDLRAFFRDAGANDPESISPQAIFPLIDTVAVRRDRRFLARHYAGDRFADGTLVRFPRPQLMERRYDLDSAFPGAFQRIASTIDALTMARYRPDSYRRDRATPAGGQEALAGLIKSGLLKRFESSVHAALLTVRRMLAMQEAVLLACREREVVPSPAAVRDLYMEVREGEAATETVTEILDSDEGGTPLGELRDEYLTHLETDRDALITMLVDLEELAARPDPKLTALATILQTSESQKIAVFTGFGDTVRYLKDALGSDVALRGGRSMGVVAGDELNSDERERLVERFCPKSVLGDEHATAPDGEIDLLISTDVLSEGQNLQQAQCVVSYDMPWNPQRVVQRNGRVIRLLSSHDEVYLYTLLPEKGELDAILELEAKLEAKIRAANASVGMESQVLAAIMDEERAFADLRDFAERLAAGDESLLEEGEGTPSGSFAGEEYRAMLMRAKQEGEVPRLKDMPWGVGATFVAHSSTPAIELPAVVFAARDRQGKRHWRGVSRDGAILNLDLELLRLADPIEASRATLPSDFDLDAAWSVAATDICDGHNALLDPAASALKLPASQRWALDLLRTPSLPDRDEFTRADEALAVPRDQAVLRALSAVRRDVTEGNRNPLDAAEEIARIVLEIFGLQAANAPKGSAYSLTQEELGVVAYQVVVPAS